VTTSSAPSLRRLIYISSATGDIGQAQLDEILNRSRSNNAARGLTGLLLFHDGCFFQVLEGEAAAIEQTYATISRDARHGGVILLESRQVQERGFPQWTMGYVRANQLHPDQRQYLIDLSARVGADQPSPLSGVTVINIHIEAFLSSFREFAIV
jgi:hypothetical protein